jgi:hypothetical protein
LFHSGSSTPVWSARHIDRQRLKLVLQGLGTLIVGQRSLSERRDGSGITTVKMKKDLYFIGSTRRAFFFRMVEIVSLILGEESAIIKRNPALNMNACLSALLPRVVVGLKPRGYNWVIE